MTVGVVCDYGVTGKTLYALILDSDSYIWNGTEMVFLNTDDWLNYDLPMTELSTSGIYSFYMPDLDAGSYGLTIRLQAGASPDPTDTSVGGNSFDWDGTEDIHPAMIDTNVAAILVDTGTDIPASIVALDAVVDTVKAETALIVEDTNELQTDNVPGLISALDAVVDTVKVGTVLILADTNAILEDTGTTLGGLIQDIPTSSEMDTKLGGADDAILAAISTMRGVDNDTLKSLSEQLDGIFTIGSGAISWEHYVDDGADPLDGVYVKVSTDVSGSNIVAADFTNAFGKATLLLDAGTYYFWKQLAGYSFTNPETVVVS